MKGRKILLINTIPSSVPAGSRPNNIPHGLLSIATWIEKNSNFDVKIIDCMVDKNYLELIKKELEGVFLAGLSVMSPCIPNAMEVTRLIKRTNPEIKIVWGGVHCKLYPEQTCRNNLIDFVVYGEGEIPLLEIVKAIYNKKPFKKIKGIVYKDKTSIIINPPADFIDLNKIGILDYKFLNPSVFSARIGTINTSRGCPHRCTYCINVVTKNTRWRAMSAENVIKEVEHLVKNYNIKLLGFSDDCFFVNRERAEKIAELLIEKKFNLSIIGAARADYFDKGIMDFNLLKKIKRAGFYNLNISPEFGSQKMIDFVKKDITKEQVIKAIKLMKKAGLGGTYAFMTGFPTETKEDTLATVNFIKQMFKLNPGVTVIKDKGKVYSWREKVRIAGPQVYRPYPGGELYDYIVKEYNWHSPETLEDWEKYFKENTRYKIEDYPWIKRNPNFYASLQFYVKSGKADISTFFKRMILPYPLKLKILTALFYPFAKFRMLTNIFDFPFEYMIGKKLGFLDELET